MSIQLSEDFIKKVRRMIAHFSTAENEATRSHQLIALLLNEMMDHSQFAIRYTAQNVDAEGKKPDFLISYREKVFFILEAKAALSSVSHKEQVKGYLKTAGIRYGCLSDGISWTMLEFDENNDKMIELKNYVLTDPQAIVDFIISKI